MGQHIVPQHLLRRISPDGATIWQYDKEAVTLDPKRLPITQVSQTRKFFSGDIEKLLSTIEGAANSVLEKLTQGRPIDPIERRVMAVYLEMYKTRSREIKGEMIEAFFGDREKIKNLMEKLFKSTPETSMYTAYKNQEEDVVDLLEAHSDQMFSAIWAPSNLDRLWFFRMTWRVLESDRTDFVVSEPPWVLTGKKDGLGHSEAEFLFPLSSNHVLHMSWRGAPSIIEKELISPVVARQINKKFIRASSRFIFFNRNCSKMARAIKNEVLFRDKKKRVEDSPYRPSRSLQLASEETGNLSEDICMHPAAANFRHAWRTAVSHTMVRGGKVIEWCAHCRAMKLKYRNEILVRNNEVGLATGKFENHRNWWMKPAAKSDRHT